MSSWAFEDFLAAQHRTRSELAADAKISLGHLSDLTSWRRSASMDVVRRLAASLRCSPETLFPQLAEQRRAAATADPEKVAS